MGSDPTQPTVVKEYENRIVPTTVENPAGPNLPPIASSEYEAGIEVNYPNNEVDFYPEFQYTIVNEGLPGAPRRCV